MVDADPDRPELARSIHLNPLRAGRARALPALDRYRWAGHSAVLGRYKRPWQAVDEILGHFGTQAGRRGASIGPLWPPASGRAAGPSCRAAG